MVKKNIYTVGGTVQAGEGIYIVRKADEELLRLCRAGIFSYVLTPRQLGKSSLMERTADQLTAEGIHSAKIDLSQMGVQIGAEQWFFGIVSIIGESICLKTDVFDWWGRHQYFGITQRLTLFFQKVLLAEVSQPIVIFVDEIDTTLKLAFADDFFVAIRYLYNARGEFPELKRLSFVLFGVATPTDLISDPHRTPFNIGQRVDLTDFTLEEALPLAQGFDLPATKAEQV
jgi:hypothetical protein